MTDYYCPELNRLAKDITAWRERKGFETTWFNVPEKLMLIVTELSEAMEEYRHIGKDVLAGLQHDVEKQGGIYEGYFSFEDVPTDVLLAVSPRVDEFKVELADALIRLLDLTGALGVDIARQVANKMDVNEGRPHRHDKEC